MMRYIGIDPSTKTGFAVLDGQGGVVDALEITTKVEEEPQKFDHLASHILNRIELTDDYPPEFLLCIEGFSYNSKGKAVSTMYGIGWIIRLQLLKRGYKYIEIPPSSLKKFVSGKGNTKKDTLAVEIYERWGFKHTSDNVRDAYALAQIARALHEDVKLTKFQEEVLKKIRG